MVLTMIIKSCAQTLAGILSLPFTKRSASSRHRCQSFLNLFPRWNPFWLFNPRSVVEILALRKLMPIFSPYTNKISGLHWQTIPSKFRKDILRAGNPSSERNGGKEKTRGRQFSCPTTSTLKTNVSFY